MKTPAFLTSLLSDYFRWTATVVAVLVVVAGYFFLLQGKFNNLQTNGFTQRSTVEADLQAEQKYYSDLQDSIAKFHQTLSAQTLQELDSFIPTGADFPGLLTMMQSLASSAGLQLDSLSTNQVGQVAVAPGTVPEGSSSAGTATAQAATAAGLNLQTQDVTLSVSGGSSYEDFKRFIGLIESSQRLLDVISLNFSQPATTQDQEGGTANSGAPYSLVVRTYYLPQSTK